MATKPKRKQRYTYAPAYFWLGLDADNSVGKPTEPAKIEYLDYVPASLMHRSTWEQEDREHAQPQRVWYGTQLV